MPLSNVATFLGAPLPTSRWVSVESHTFYAYGHISSADDGVIFILADTNGLVADKLYDLEGLRDLLVDHKGARL